MRHLLETVKGQFIIHAWSNKRLSMRRLRVCLKQSKDATWLVNTVTRILAAADILRVLGKVHCYKGKQPPFFKKKKKNFWNITSYLLQRFSPHHLYAFCPFEIQAEKNK